MIGRIIVSEVERAAREKAARNRAAARSYPPMPPASPPRRTSPGTVILGVACFAGVIALIVVPMVRSHDQQDALLSNQQTCSDVWEWTASYDVGLADEIGPASLTPDPQLRGDVQVLLNTAQAAPVTSQATVTPTRAVRAAMHALMGRCGRWDSIRAATTRHPSLNPRPLGMVRR